MSENADHEHCNDGDHPRNVVRSGSCAFHECGDLWICGPHRVLCGDSTNAEAVGRVLRGQRPLLMVTDPPYGVELDSEWRDRAGINKRGAAEPSYLKRRSEGHTETTISGDTIADWSHAF